jgi:beta-glucanase (GH16 family)
VKFPRERGQHGAFWLQRSGVAPVPGNPRASGAEIDIAEFFGKGYPSGGFASFVYYLNEDDENEKVGGLLPEATRDLPPGDAWWRSYHVFSVEWTPKRYVFRVDGREIGSIGKGVSGVEQFLVLSLLSSDYELGRINASSLPSTMEVDWVRVWQRPRQNE